MSIHKYKVKYFVFNTEINELLESVKGEFLYSGVVHNISRLPNKNVDVIKRTLVDPSVCIFVLNDKACDPDIAFKNYNKLKKERCVKKIFVIHLNDYLISKIKSGVDVRKDILNCKSFPSLPSDDVSFIIKK